MPIDFQILITSSVPYWFSSSGPPATWISFTFSQPMPFRTLAGLGHNGFELRGILDEQEYRKAERVDAEPLAGHRENVCIVVSRA